MEGIIKYSLPAIALIYGLTISGCTASETETDTSHDSMDEPFAIQAVIGESKTVFTPPFKVEWAEDDALSVIVNGKYKVA